MKERNMDCVTLKSDEQLALIIYAKIGIYPWKLELVKKVKR